MGRHKNPAQEAIIINFMQRYPALARGTIQCKQKRNELWEALTAKLNSRGPPTKTIHRWKKVWVDWRAAVRRKVIYEKFEANAPPAPDDEILYKTSSLSPAEGQLARICKFFEAVNSLDMQDDSNSVSDGAVVVVKNELLLDDEDDENSNHSDVNGSEKSAEAETISTQAFDQCPSTSNEVKVKVENSEENIEIKKRRIDVSAAEETEGLTKLLKQQTTVISTITKFLAENVNWQTENLRVVNEIRLGLKQVCEVIKILNDTTHDTLKEQRRHNYEIEKLQREEVLLAKQQLELEELKVFGSTLRE